jgi:small neutral amino acid transporter SnatA (MarC family)
MKEILKYSTFLLILLNPFWVIVYLIDIMRKLSFPRFRNVLIRAGIIGTLVFIRLKKASIAWMHHT